MNFNERKASVPDYSEFTDDELRQEQIRVSGVVAEIKAQLDRARALHQIGEHYDPEWFASAKSAKRFHSLQYQAIQAEQASRNRAYQQAVAKEKKQEDERFERRFMRVAKALLPSTTYNELIAATQRALAQSESTSTSPSSDILA